MKRNQSLVANGNLSLDEKKRKILRSLRRLEGLGVLRPPQAENQILQMIAKVTNRTQTHLKQEVMSQLCVFSQRFLQFEIFLSLHCGVGLGSVVTAWTEL